MEHVSDIPTHVPRNAVVDFDMNDPPDLQKGLQSAWRALQKQGTPDLVWTARNGGHWIATRGEDVAAFYRDHENFSSRIMLVPLQRGLESQPLPGSIDPPDHGPYRALLNGPLSPKAVKDLEPEIRALTIALIEQLKPQGECNFVAEFSIILPLTIFISYAGLPHSDLEYLRQLAEEKVRPTGKWSAGEIMQRFADYLDPYVRERSASPGGDLLSRILIGKINDRPLTHEEAIRLCTQVLQAGLDTVAALLAFTFYYLARAPKLRAQLAADPSLIPKAIEEFTRLGAVIAITREVREDYDHRGVIMKKGDLLVLPTMLHSLDETIFSNALEVDLERPRKELLTFAQGPHRCPGAQLARSELRIVLEEWFARIPDFTLHPDRDPKFASGVVCSMKQLPLKWKV